MTKELESFYDKLWELLKTKLGDSVDCDEMTDRIYDLITEYYDDIDKIIPPGVDPWNLRGRS